MNTRARPLILAAALALGVSAPAFGQAGSSGDSGGNTNSLTAQGATAPVTPAAPVTSGSGDPIVRGAAPADTYHGTTAAPSAAVRTDEDANERAARAATTTSEEEHGGLRNRLHQKKDRARAKVGMQPDHD